MKPQSQTQLSQVFLLVAVVLGACPVSLMAAVVGYWRFEEGSVANPAIGAATVLDSSSNHLDATPFNGPVYSANVPPLGNAHPNSLSMEFNGSNQRLFVPDDPRLHLTQSLTIEAFIYT